MMKFGMLSASVLLMTLSGCSLNEAEEDVGGAPGSWVNSGGSGPMAAAGSGPIGTGGGPAAGGATGSGGYGVGGTGAGGESSDCNEIVAECYSAAYACCGQGVDEQCEMMAGNCASIICENPYPYPLQCTDYIVPVDEAIDEAQAFELAVNTCANLGLTATGAELLELGVFVTCCPDPNGGMGTGGSGWGAGGSTGGTSSGTGGYESGAGGYEMGTGGYEPGTGGYAAGGTTGADMGSGSGGFSMGGTGMGAGGTGVVIPGFCSGVGGVGGEGGASTGGTGPMGGEGGFATGGMPAD
jgi:hypothetical protein